VAIVARIVVEAAGIEDHDRLEQAVEKRFVHGPPEGLMVHLGYPQGGHLFIVEAWRTEEPFRSNMVDVLGPALEEAGLTAREPEVGPAWSIARP
jgi:hypothetical protein